MQVKLTIIKGPHPGKEFVFHGHENFIVGRGPQAHFRLSKLDKFFSRLHFMVEINPPACRLLDLNSRNGTRVNKQKVTRADLEDGDVIRWSQPGPYATFVVRRNGSFRPDSVSNWVK